jgi:NADPH:quinone reductase-like Zn-dependent oxidoreductase
MRAAVIHSLGGGPTVEEFPDPAPEDDVAEVVAAPLNPVDLIIVAGQMPFRKASPPFVAGVEGIFRNKLVGILPHTNWSFSAAERAAAFEQLAAYAQSGALRLDVERVPLDDAASAWTRLATGTATRKLVIVP